MTLRSLNYFLIEGEDLFILHNQYHCCWWPDNTRSQGISSNCINLVLLEYSSFTTKRLKHKENQCATTDTLMKLGYGYDKWETYGFVCQKKNTLICWFFKTTDKFHSKILNSFMTYICAYMHSLQNKIWNLPDRSTILPKFIYGKGKPTRLTPVLPVRVRGPALILKTICIYLFWSTDVLTKVSPLLSGQECFIGCRPWLICGLWYHCYVLCSILYFALDHVVV